MVTPGNHSTNCDTSAPSSRFSNNAATGTRVPRNTHAPLTRSGSRSTAGQDDQSIIGAEYHREKSTSNRSPLFRRVMTRKRASSGAQARRGKLTLMFAPGHIRLWTSREARQTLEITLAIEESARTCKAVKLGN